MRIPGHADRGSDAMPIKNGRHFGTLIEIAESSVKVLQV
jgi:hypothetical protein